MIIAKIRSESGTRIQRRVASPIRMIFCKRSWISLCNTIMTFLIEPSKVPRSWFSDLFVFTRKPKSFIGQDGWAFFYFCSLKQLAGFSSKISFKFESSNNDLGTLFYNSSNPNGRISPGRFHFLNTTRKGKFEKGISSVVVEIIMWIIFLILMGLLYPVLIKPSKIVM